MNMDPQPKPTTSTAPYSTGAATSWVPRLPRSVWALSLTSFFADTSSDMIFPLLPAFLTTLGASPMFLGTIEGVSDAVASSLKVLAGNLADRMPRKKPLVFLGYVIAGTAKPLAGLATIPLHILSIRVSDRVGKGIRTAPRDAILAATASAEQAGRAFGIHRAFDHAGAIVGPLLASALLALGWDMRSVFLAAAVPSLLAVLMIIPVQETPSAPNTSAVTPAKNAMQERVPSFFWQYVGLVLLFSSLLASDAFVILRMTQAGIETKWLPLLWSLVHIIKMSTSLLGGFLADRYSKISLVALSWGLLGLIFLGLAWATEIWQVIALFLLYGFAVVIPESPQRALVKELIPASLHGRAYGFYHGAEGVGALVAGLSIGWLWESQSYLHALTASAATALVAALLLLLWQRRHHQKLSLH